MEIEKERVKANINMAIDDRLCECVCAHLLVNVRVSSGGETIYYINAIDYDFFYNSAKVKNCCMLLPKFLLNRLHYTKTTFDQ